MEQNLSILQRYMYIDNKNGVHDQMNGNESCTKKSKINTHTFKKT